MNQDIDFVILWVDDGDNVWQQEKQKYSNDRDGKSHIYFRDWDNLQYIFRAFEKFTPWVRTIHFVTWGHLPKWLNIGHPKLHIVKHEDYIDSKFLPLFSANPLEANLHNICGLSEKFIFFNDDLFITQKIDKTRFFKDDLPCDMLVSNALSSSSGVGHFVLNNLEILNRHFNKRTVMKQNYMKWFAPAYGKEIIRNIALSPWPRFTGFADPHMPQPFLKSTFEEVWSREKEVLELTSASKFRNCTDVNQYLFRYWQLAQGNFHPVSMRDTKYVTLNMTDLRKGTITEMISSGKYSIICLNDGESIQTDEDFEEAKNILQEAFEKILPHKSSFEI